VPADAELGDAGETHLGSYRRLADMYRLVLSELSLDSVLDRIAGTLSEIVPYDTLTIYQSDEAQRHLIPVLARDEWAEEIMNDSVLFGEGLTGWAAEHREPLLANDAHDDPRVAVVPGTPMEPESLIIVPLIARDRVKGCLNVYRLGEGRETHFSEAEFELAQRFGDAAALAIDNIQIRAILERQAQTDPLTGLYNHRAFQERLRAELTRANRAHDSVALLMFDIDDFKRVNDVHGHSAGDQVLVAIADCVRETVRGSDLPCRIGGEEFAVVLPSCNAGDALGLAGRLSGRLAELELEHIHRVTVSAGVAQGPEHAMNPRELVACADAAMLTAKSRGKDRVVLFEDSDEPEHGSQAASASDRDVRSIAHLKMLQSLAGKLNRMNDVRQIAATIANELRTLIDYHSCRVYLAEGTALLPIAFRGEMEAYEDDTADTLTTEFGEGITGRTAETGRSLLIANALECDFGVTIPGTDDIEESMVAVPLSYGSKVIGVVTISKLGIGQFDEDDVRLLEVLAGHASVALENARLYEAQKREADNLKALLDFADMVSKTQSFHAIGDQTVRTAARLLSSKQASLWLQQERSNDYHCAAHFGYVGDPTVEAVVRERVRPEDGDRLIAGRTSPLQLTPEEQDEYFPTPATVASRTLAIAPLDTGHGVRGWITVRNPEGSAGRFGEEQLRLVAGLSYQASVAMQKCRLYKDEKESAEIANALLEFGRELALAQGLDDVLNKTVELSARILGSPKTLVWLQEPETGDLLPEAQWGYSGSQREGMARIRIPDDIARKVLRGSDPFVLRPEDLPYVEGAEALSGDPLYAVAPVEFDGRLGAITAVAPALGDYVFSERKIRLLAGIATQSKLAIMNASSFESLERTFFETVEALANALEAKDEYISTHARSITDMCIEVGSAMGISGKDLKRLELGGLFHDIGKIGIPSRILTKPGPLDDEEWAIIRTHPELGERILAPIDRLADVRPIIRHCHEHFDGSGYPDGLVGADIPIESRIILVVDAFDAMTTDRPYRVRLPVEEAVRRLKESAGRQFDPRLVELFIETVVGNLTLLRAV
jgi:diguanylate cyclase (GGDEF)-like protein